MLLDDGNVAVAPRKDAIRPANAPIGTVRRILRVAKLHAQTLRPTWEALHDYPENMTDAEWEESLDPEVEASIEAARERAKLLQGEVLARNVEYVASHNILVLTLTNGRRLVLPVEDLQGLQTATPQQLSQAEILGPGTSLHFEDLDADFYVPYLLEGIYGNERWMRQLEARNAQVAA